jgi:uncharacterized protein (DUF1499 family)
MASFKSARTWSIVALVIALLLLAGTAYAIVGSRNGLTDYRSAFGLLRQIAQIGAGALVLSIITLLFSLKSRHGVAYAASATVLIAVLVGLLVLNQAAPPPGALMNDITTDLDDPPKFDAVIPLRPEGSNPADYAGAVTAANQRAVHPEVQPIRSHLPPTQAFEQALRVAEAMGWDIVAENTTAGTIEAVDTTAFFRFKDDIVIRVRPDGVGSRIDLRSHSRVGVSDLGKNAARIVEYSVAFTERTSQ